MAAMVATSLAIAGTGSSSSRPSTGVAFAGLKVRNRLTSLGCSPSVDEQFSKMRAVCMKARRPGGSAAGGALACKASIADEIFRVVPIMSVLVLVGISVGFVLLRVEQALEESEE